MKFLLALCLVAAASGSVFRPQTGQGLGPSFLDDGHFLRPVIPEDTPILRPVVPEDTPILRPVVPEEENVLRPVLPEDTPILRPVFPEEEHILRPVFPEEENLGSNFPGTGEIAPPAKDAPLVQIIINVQKSAGSAPAVEVPAEVEQVPDFGPPAAIEEIPDVPVVAPEFQPETPIAPLVPIVPDERPPVGLFPIIPDLNRPGLPGANPELVRPIIPDDLDLAPDGLPWRF